MERHFTGTRPAGAGLSGRQPDAPASPWTGTDPQAFPAKQGIMAAGLVVFGIAMIVYGAAH